MTEHEDEVGEVIRDLTRGRGTVSVIGVYGGAADPMPMLRMFDKQVHLRIGQANVKHWVDEIMPLLSDGDVLGVESFATHRVPLAEAPQAYETFQKEADGAVKFAMTP